MKKRSIFMLLILLVTAFAFGINAQVVKADGPSVSYRTHVQDYGWQGWKHDGEMSGTSGESKRLEGIELKLNLDGFSGGIKYRTHVQNIGWQDWKHDGEMSGTSGQSLRLEAIQIELTGEIAEEFDVYYRVHAQNFGWLDWASNGQKAGTADYGYRLEAIEISLYPKYDDIEKDTDIPYIAPDIKYQTHVQNIGWQDWKKDTEVSGTSGQSLRLEGIKIQLFDPEYNGGVEYQTHVQNIGWQDWKSDGQMAGTSGLSYRLEGIRIRLTGEMANHYDIYYRTHVQNIGWQDWKTNGEMSGTSGQSLRLEAIQIFIIEKERTISYDLNGGTMEEGYEDEVETYQSLDGLPAYEPEVNPTKEGYIFNGWTLNGEPYYFDEPIYSDVTLVADWAETVNVTLDLDGGTLDDETEFVDQLPKGYRLYSVMLPTPTKEGYAFAGWAISDPEMGDGPLIDGTEINKDITLKATWGEPITLTLNPNGGELSINENVISIAKGSTLANLHMNVSKEDSVFIGWVLDGSNPEYIYPWDEPINENISLTAKWEESITLSFDLDGGTWSLSELMKTGKNFSLNQLSLPTPTKEGYAFAGWTVNGELIDNETPLTEDTALKATWSQDSVTITLDPNGGSLTGNQSEHIIARGTYFTPQPPMRDGYWFNGWMIVTSEGEEPYDTSKPVTEDMTLKASWQETITVTLDLDGGEIDGPTECLSAKGMSYYPGDPTKEGYVFTGWVKITSQGEEPYDSPEELTEDTTFKATWALENNGE